MRYGISDEQAWSVGLACGSTIEVLVEPELRAEVEVGARASDDRVIPIALPDGSGEFEEVFPAPRRLVVYGAVEIARPLVRLAHELGYRVVVVDARSAFATAERFPEADELIVGWPDEVGERVCLATSDSVAVLAHDPKLDDPALLIAFVRAAGTWERWAARRRRLSGASGWPLRECRRPTSAGCTDQSGSTWAAGSRPKPRWRSWPRLSPTDMAGVEARSQRDRARAAAVVLAAGWERDLARSRS